MSGGVIDQIFVLAKQRLLSAFAGPPDWLLQIISSLVNIIALLGAFLALIVYVQRLSRFTRPARFLSLKGLR